MGKAIERDRFDPHEYAQFGARLEHSIEALRSLLSRQGFGHGPATLGSELELFLIDGKGRPLPVNQKVLAETVDPRITYELNQYNLECNTRPTLLRGRGFSALGHELRDILGEVRRSARAHRGRVALIGILPTLRPEDLGMGALTDVARYRALGVALRRKRKKAFRFHISGPEPLQMTWDDHTFGGANTSFQIHLRVNPEDFSRVYNAVQMATAPALAAGGNSPFFLGHLLWEETRVALFKQATDDRREIDGHRLGSSRTSFGSAWVGDGALELFREAVRLHDPVLPILSEEDPLERTRSGGVPRLSELRLHQGTVWTWNRPVYDAAGGGHVRIEMRALPSGPTITDMLANGAFLVGLALGLAPEADAWVKGFPFAEAHRNFYRSAKRGLEAVLRWPREPGLPASTVWVKELIPNLLPLAQEGLERAEVDPDEARELLEVIRERATTGLTGSAWQRRTLAALDAGMERPQALAEMFRRYLELAESDRPVHSWPLEEERIHGKTAHLGKSAGEGAAAHGGGAPEGAGRAHVDPGGRAGTVPDPSRGDPPPRRRTLGDTRRSPVAALR